MEMFDVREKVFNILEKRFELDKNTLSEDFCNKKLLGKSIGLKARDLIYLYYDVETEFQISIPEKEIINGRFDNLNDIIEIICHQLYQQKYNCDIKKII